MLIEECRYWMSEAINVARSSVGNEVPVGAVVVNGRGQLIGIGRNSRESCCDPAAHAEVLALRAAGATVRSWHLESSTMYVTLEPCLMCAGAILMSRLGLLVYGADNFETGAVRSMANLLDSPASNYSVPVIGGVMEAECRELVQRWFYQRRSRRAM